MSIIDFIEGITFRELKHNELREFDIVCLEARKKHDIYYEANTKLIHNDTFLPSFIKPLPSLLSKKCGIVIVALGKEKWCKQFPELYFRKRMVIGFYAVEFAASDLGDSEYRPYMIHKKRKFHIYTDRMYVMSPFRGSIKILNGLVNKLEEVLKKYGYGNIESKPDDFLQKFLKRKGFIRGNPNDDLRWGKLL